MNNLTTTPQRHEAAVAVALNPRNPGNLWTFAFFKDHGPRIKNAEAPMIYSLLIIHWLLSAAHPKA